MTSLFFTLAAFAISANAVPPLISEMAASTGVGAPNFGFFMFIQYVAFSLASFTGSYIRKRFGISNHFMVAIGLAVIVLSLAIAGVFLRSYWSLALWVVPLGFSGGAVETFSSIQISSLSNANSSKSLCVSQVFYSLGALAAPQIVYLCLGFRLSWNEIFFVFAALSALVMVLFLVVNRHRLRSIRTTAESPHETAGASGPAQIGGSLYVVFLLVMLCYVAVESLSASWLSYAFEKEYLLTARNAALVLVAFWLGMLVGRFTVVLIPSRLTLWPTLLASSALLMMATLLLLVTPGLIVSIAAVCILGASAGPMWPVLVMASSSIFRSERKTATIIGIGALGFAAGPVIGSRLVNAGSIRTFHYAQVLLSVIVVLLTYLAYFLYRKRSSPQQNDPDNGGRTAGKNEARVVLSP